MLPGGLVARDRRNEILCWVVGGATVVGEAAEGGVERFARLDLLAALARFGVSPICNWTSTSTSSTMAKASGPHGHAPADSTVPTSSQTPPAASTGDAHDC
jgi:hypothetical protein